MAINTTPEKKPAGDGNPTAGYAINNAYSPTTAQEDKTYWTIRAGFAFKGYALYRSNPADGPVNYWAECSGSKQTFRSIEDAGQFLDQIGGSL